jgi:hypothetical protein
VLEAFPNLADVDDWDSSQRKDVLDMFSNLADVDDWDVSEMTATESVRRMCQAVDGGANLEHAVRDDPATISFVAGADVLPLPGPLRGPRRRLRGARALRHPEAQPRDGPQRRLRARPCRLRS